MDSTCPFRMLGTSHCFDFSSSVVAPGVPVRWVFVFSSHYIVVWVVWVPHSTLSLVFHTPLDACWPQLFLCELSTICRVFIRVFSTLHYVSHVCWVIMCVCLCVLLEVSVISSTDLFSWLAVFYPIHWHREWVQLADWVILASWLVTLSTW